jgi:hypothetical protein
LFFVVIRILFCFCDDPVRVFSIGIGCYHQADIENTIDKSRHKTENDQRHSLLTSSLGTFCLAKTDTAEYPPDERTKQCQENKQNEQTGIPALFDLGIRFTDTGTPILFSKTASAPDAHDRFFMNFISAIRTKHFLPLVFKMK